MILWNVDSHGGVRVKFAPGVEAFVRKLRQELAKTGPYKPLQPHLQVTVSDEVAVQDPLATFEAGHATSVYQKSLEEHWAAQERLVSSLFDEELLAQPGSTVYMDSEILALLHQWFARVSLIMNQDKLADRIGVGEPLLADEDLQKFLESGTEPAGEEPLEEPEEEEDEPEGTYEEQLRTLPRILATMLAYVHYKALMPEVVD